MKKKSSSILQIIIFVLIGLHGNAQDEIIKGFVPTEQVIVQMDRTVYIAGESIVFHATVMEGTYQIPIDLSQVLYVELYNQLNKPVEQLKIKIHRGIGEGTIDIPKQLLSDYYYVRAYTNYMKNQGARSYFTKKIAILNPFIDEIPQVPLDGISEHALSIDYFPEGGKILANTKNKLLVHLQDNSKMGVNADGYINNVATKDTVVSFKTDELGFADITFSPLQGEEYNIVVSMENKHVIKRIRNIQSAGNNLHITTLTEKSIILTSLHSLNDEKTYSLTGSKYNHDVGLNQLLVENSDEIVVPKKKLPPGLTLLKLTNQTNQIIAQKWVYNDKKGPRTDFGFETHKDTYKPGESVSLNIQTANSEDFAKIHNMLISVVHTDSLQTNAYPSFSDVLLVSQLRHQGLQLTDNQIKKIINHPKGLDRLLIMLDNAAFPKTDKMADSYVPETTGDILSGTVTFDNKPIENATVMQSFIDDIHWIESVQTDKSGKFNFHLTNVKEINRELVLLIKNGHDAYTIEVDNEFSNDFIEIEQQVFYPSDFDLDFVKKQMIHLQVLDAFADSISVSEINSSGHSFYGKPDVTYKLEKYVELPDFEEFIFEILKGVKTTIKQGKKYIQLFNPSNSFIIGNQPLILVDGIPVYDHASILRLKPSDLKEVHLVLHKYFYKNQTFDGIMDIITNDGDGSAAELPELLTRILFPGIQPVSSGIWLNQAPEEENTPDYRNLILWETIDNKSNTGKFGFTFSLPDYQGDFIIKCSGITKEGITVDAAKTLHIR